MEKSDYLEWLTLWFQEKIQIDHFDPHTHFFDRGLLNSFNTLLLVSDIESHFNLLFSDSALSDPRFVSIDGLSSILVDIQKNTGALC